MAYMERKRFVHRDLAARNILMQSHSRVITKNQLINSLIKMTFLDKNI
jgi:hypothetical protein